MEARSAVIRDRRPAFRFAPCGLRAGHIRQAQEEHRPRVCLAGL